VWTEIRSALKSGNEERRNIEVTSSAAPVEQENITERGGDSPAERQAQIMMIRDVPVCFLSSAYDRYPEAHWLLNVRDWGLGDREAVDCSVRFRVHPGAIPWRNTSSGFGRLLNGAAETIPELLPGIGVLTGELNRWGTA
jgi:hypothetical protein